MSGAWPYRNLSVGTVDPPLRRDATSAELRSEPDIILRELAAGRMGATATTAELAKAELAYRRLRT